LLGGLGLVLCVVGLIKCWAVRDSLSHTSARACERAGQVLDLAANSLGPIRAGLEKAREDIDALHDSASAPAPREPEKQRSRQAVLSKLAGQLTPRLRDAEQALAVVSETGVVLDALLEQLEEVPLARVARLDPDEVRDTSERIRNLSASARRLSRILEKTPAEGESEEVTGYTSRMKEALAQATRRIGNLVERVEMVRDRVTELPPELHDWLTRLAILATVLLVWAGIGQIGLLFCGWSSFRVLRRTGCRSPA
jgi:hypothetical protein